MNKFLALHSIITWIWHIQIFGFRILEVWRVSDWTFYSSTFCSFNKVVSINAWLWQAHELVIVWLLVRNLTWSTHVWIITRSVWFLIYFTVVGIRIVLTLNLIIYEVLNMIFRWPVLQVLLTLPIVWHAVGCLFLLLKDWLRYMVWCVHI